MMACFTQPVYKTVCVKVLEGIFVCVEGQIYTAVEISCNIFSYLSGPTPTIPSHFTVTVLFSSVSIVVTKHTLFPEDWIGQ